MKKTNWIQLTALCFILSLTVACGGKNSSGGGGGGVSHDPYMQVDGGVLAPALQNTIYGDQSLSVFNQVKSWASREDNGRILSNTFTRGQVQVTASQDNCSTGTFLKFFNYEVCKSGSLNNQFQGFATTPTHYCTILENGGAVKIGSVTSDQLPINNWGGCNLTNFSIYSKSSNAELVSVLNLNNGHWRLYGASFDQRNSNIAYLLVGDHSGNASKLFVIDMGYHSIYNPMGIKDLASGAEIKTLFLK